MSRLYHGPRDLLRTLERFGYLLSEDGSRFDYHGCEPPEWEWANGLIEQLRRHRRAVREIAEARRLFVLELDYGLTGQEMDWGRLVGYAVAGVLPCYVDGVRDSGAAGWNKIRERGTS